MKLLVKIAALLILTATAQAGPPVLWNGVNAKFINSGGVQIPAGSGTAPSLFGSGALTSGLSWITDGVALSTNATERFRIDSSGLFTFGSTTSGAAKFNIVNQGDVATGGLRLMDNVANASGNWDFWSRSDHTLWIQNPGRGVRYLFGGGGGLAIGGVGTEAQAALEIRGSDTGTTPSATSLIAGNVKSNLFSVTNTDTTANNFSAMVFGSNSSLWTSGIMGVHEVKGASPSGHMEFYVNNAGTITKRFNLAKDGQPTFSFFSSAGLVQTDSSGVLTSNNTLGTSVVMSADPTTSLQPATKSYVDGLINGRDWKQDCRLVTVAALPTNVYSNGVSGVGATLTGTSNGALSVDGTTVAVGDRILVKDESTGANDGIYTVTATGGVAAVYVLTRATDFNQASEIEDGDSTYITAGSTKKASNWTLSVGGAVTVGTTSLVFIQTGYGTLAAGAGISISESAGTTTISASGTPAANLVTKTADYSVTSTDNVIIANCSTACTLTLESAATGGAGTTHRIKKIGTAIVTIATTSSQTIDGDTTLTLTDLNVSVDLISDGSNWYVF